MLCEPMVTVAALVGDGGWRRCGVTAVDGSGGSRGRVGSGSGALVDGYTGTQVSLSREVKKRRSE